MSGLKAGFEMVVGAIHERVVCAGSWLHIVGAALVGPLGW